MAAGDVYSDEGDAAAAETESEHKIYSRQRSRMNGSVEGVRDGGLTRWCLRLRVHVSLGVIGHGLRN